MVPSNHSNFQYFNSNIGLSSIAPCKVSLLITLHPFWYQFFCSFSKFTALPTIHSFSLVQVILKRLLLHFANAFKSIKELSQQLEEQELYWKPYRKEAMNQSTKLIQNRIRATTFAIAKLKQHKLNGEQRVKIIISHFDGSNNIFAGCIFFSRLIPID